LLWGCAEEEQHNARALKQLEAQLAELKEKIKAHKPAAAKALKDIKKHLGDRDKHIKEQAKKTMLRERKERRALGDVIAASQAAAGTAAQFERGTSTKDAPPPSLLSVPTPGLAHGASARRAQNSSPVPPPGRSAKEVDMMLAQFEADGDDAQAVVRWCQCGCFIFLSLSLTQTRRRMRLWRAWISASFRGCCMRRT
jgi:hypothetical protein